MPENLHLIPLPDLPLIRPGDDLAQLIVAASQKVGLTLTDTDIVVVAQKIISKTEGRFVRLSEVTPSPQALALAETTGKPAEQVEVILWTPP
ncbi:MAG: coenzyme F420-0:L-glutamate ligase, partial [Anaerolineales bacterium]|nr:coenzyme F420-0:L-glutamate ligase [Anaerolineales bacterium]